MQAIIPYADLADITQSGAGSFGVLEKADVSRPMIRVFLFL